MQNAEHDNEAEHINAAQTSGAKNRRPGQRRRRRGWITGAIAAMIALLAAGLTMVAGVAPAAAEPGFDLLITLTSDGVCDESDPPSLLVPSGTTVTFCYFAINTSDLEVIVGELETLAFGLLDPISAVIGPNETWVWSESVIVSGDVADSAVWTSEDQAGDQHFATASAYLSMCAPSPIRYVDTTGTGADGLTWASAYTNLHHALIEARPCTNVDEIRIAGGTYITTTNFDQDASFEMVDNVDVTGGFAPGGSATPDPVANETVLSGDLSGNDSASAPEFFITDSTRFENANTVVTVPGHFLGSLRYVTVSDGHAVGDAGGLQVLGTGYVLDHIVVERNFARVQGGGLYLFGILMNSTVRDNAAGSGGGVRHLGTILNSVITGNVAVGSASQEGAGGGIFGTYANAKVVNTVVANNSADRGGGAAIYGAVPSASVDFFNSLIIDNTADRGGAISWRFALPTAPTTLNNTIVWGNTATTFPGIDDVPVTAEYSDVQGGVLPGTGNISADPVHADPLMGDYRIKPSSPALDAGSDALVPFDLFDVDDDGDTAEPTPDLVHAPRIDGPAVDMGPIELDLPNCAGMAITIDMNLPGENGTGTPNDDVILGTPGDDVITGLGGHDVICGEGGNDEIYGNDGDDNIYGGDGNDLLYGSAGDDDIYGGAGVDRVFGQDGTDFIDGEDGDDRLYGGAGNDGIEGGNGNDRVWGQAGEDTIYTGIGDDTILGGIDADYIDAGPGLDVVHGQGGDDIIYGYEDADTLYGNTGHDHVYGGTGDDFLYGHGGIDTMRGGDGNDELFGGGDDDHLYGDDDDDQIFGQGGNDILFGGDGTNDLCHGGIGGGDSADSACETMTAVP